MAESLRIGMVAGEKSGDNLGAGFMRELLKRYPQARFEGIGGPAMVELGFHSLFPMERLSVMGFVEPLSRLPELLAIDRQLRAHFLHNPPDVFVGIDAPGFNTRFEKILRQHGIRTAHYVSPSVWAYREKRIHKIRQAVDLMLVLFPFEVPIYEAHDIPVACVGHPLADELDSHYDMQAARAALNLEARDTVIALLPGSRVTEVRRLAPLFLDLVERCRQLSAPIRFVVPCANPELRVLMEQQLSGRNQAAAVTLLDGNARGAVMAADLVILASGTASLETMLLGKPMVICYKVATLTYLLAARLLKVPYVGLPNLLAGEKLVPEYLQQAATVDNLFAEVVALLEHPDSWAGRLLRFEQIHQQLARHASQRAVDAVMELVNSGQGGRDPQQ
ncbi:MAG: lipid-A-disaccharide synthase [Gammaproteobacteria bacterium]|nr:lipid-A-disaccharide synthase [Pseudomonadales bacterium]MCP5346411.1 lipid-A-disaccharide synthase [Pseudomonadales bacterium]